MATRRQIAHHTGGGGHDGAVGRGDVNPHSKVVGTHPDGFPIHAPTTKHDVHGMHDQAVKDGRTQDAHDLHKHLEDVHGGGGFHGGY